MKQLLKHVRTIAFTVLFVLLVSSVNFVSAQVNVIGSEEAVELAVHYYCLNSLDQDVVTFDDYAVTPLYDETGAVTYYCVDFFYQDQGKGYVVVAGNLTDFQCPEISLEETSIYYQDMQEGKTTIYYNPFEVFTVEEDTYVDMNGCEVSEDEVVGEVVGGDLLENRAIMTVADEVGDPLQDPRVFSVHPIQYLSGLGYTNLSSNVYGTIETAMNNANAFNQMYFAQSLPIALPAGTVLREGGHCALTALSNVMMYWESIYSTAYPDTYDEIFEKVLQTAMQMGAFSNTSNGDGVSTSQLDDIFHAVNQSYNYSGRSYENHSNSIEFLRYYIDAGWPVMLGLYRDSQVASYEDSSTESSPFYSTPHMTVAFGYCEVVGYIGSHINQYTFVKFYDGHVGENRGKVYICWDMVEMGEYYLDDPICSDMYAFCPY